MTPRRAWLGLGILGFLLLIGTCLWWFWLVPAQLLSLVGMAGPWLTSHRTCERTTDGRLIRCDSRSQPPYTPINKEVVIFSSTTSRLVLLDHQWDVRDSIDWARQRDSIRLAMSHRHGRTLTCDAIETSRDWIVESHRLRPDAPGPQSIDYWRLAHADVRLMAARWPPSSGSPKDVWAFQMTTFPNPSPICQTPRVVHHLMTWDELMASWRDWLADQFR